MEPVLFVEEKRGMKKKYQIISDLSQLLKTSDSVRVPRVWHHAHRHLSLPKMDMSAAREMWPMQNGWSQLGVSLIIVPQRFIGSCHFKIGKAVFGGLVWGWGHLSDFSLRQPRRHSPFLVHWLQLSVNGSCIVNRLSCSKALAKRLPWSLGALEFPWTGPDSLREALLAVATQVIRCEPNSSGSESSTHLRSEECFMSKVSKP